MSTIEGSLYCPDCDGFGTDPDYPCETCEGVGMVTETHLERLGFMPDLYAEVAKS